MSGVSMSGVIKYLMIENYQSSTSVEDLINKFIEATKKYTYEADVSIFDSVKKENVMMKRMYPIYSIQLHSNSIYIYTKSIDPVVFHWLGNQTYKEAIEDFIK